MEHMPFGAFNPRFYGISILLGGQDRIDAISRYQEAASPADWAKGTPSLDDVVAVSAVDHERRHFHDFLLSPCGTTTMGLRMQASINGIQAMKAIEQSPGKFVPVPILRWMEWSAAERQQWVASNGSFCGIERTEDLVALPYLADFADTDFKVGGTAVPERLPREQQLNFYAIAAARGYRSMDKLSRHHVIEFDMDVTADGVFEGVAHLVQTQAVWTGQGEAAAQLFLEFIEGSSATHLAPLQTLWAVLRRGKHQVHTQRLAELFTWMLLGHWEQLNAEGHPASRYFRILELAAVSPNHDLFTRRMATSELFDRLDAQVEARAWKENLASASESADRRKNLYSNLSQTLRGGYFDDLFEVAQAWHADQATVKQVFLTEPESLAHPLRYLNEPRLPWPFLETRLGWAVHARDEKLDKPNSRAIVVDEEGKQVLSYISQLDSKPPTRALDGALTTRLLTHMVDFLFSDEPILDLYEDWCRSRVERILKKKIVSVY